MTDIPTYTDFYISQRDHLITLMTTIIAPTKYGLMGDSGYDTIDSALTIMTTLHSFALDADPTASTYEWIRSLPYDADCGMPTDFIEGSLSDLLIDRIMDANDQ